MRLEVSLFLSITNFLDLSTCLRLSLHVSISISLYPSPALLTIDTFVLAESGDITLPLRFLNPPDPLAPFTLPYLSSFLSALNHDSSFILYKHINPSPLCPLLPATFHPLSLALHVRALSSYIISLPACASSLHTSSLTRQSRCPPRKQRHPPASNPYKHSDVFQSLTGVCMAFLLLDDPSE